MADQEPTLHIDDDWKAQAQAEKQKLAQSVETESGRPMPDAEFAALVQLIAMQAVIGLGGFAGPGGQEIPPNLDAAKHHIDMLDMLEQKTRGNLTDDEKRLLDTTIHQLRMAYVDTVRGGPPSGAAPPPGPATPPGATPR